MGRRMVAVAVGALVMAGACSTDREVTRPEPEPVTADNVGAALLTVDDLPDGYTEGGDAATSLAVEVLPEHACDDELTELEAEEEQGIAFTGLSGDLGHTVAWFPGDGRDVEQLVRDIAKDCNDVVATDSSLAVRVEPLDFGALTDDTYALRFEIEPPTGPIEERDLIFIRRGDLVTVVRLDGLRPSDKTLLDTAVRVALGRIGALDDATS